MSTPTVHHLGTGHEEIESLRSGVFAVLVGLTTGVVAHYLSDVYYDAMWLNSQLTKPMEFYYSVGTCGTGIGSDEIALYREHKYKCAVAVDDRRRWTLTVTPV